MIWGYVASAWTLMALTWELGISGLFSDISIILALSMGADSILAALGCLQAGQEGYRLRPA